MAAARKREKKEKDITGQLLGNIGFRGLTRDEAAGRDGLIKQLTGRMLRKALEDFGETWNGKYPMICQSRLRRWAV